MAELLNVQLRPEGRMFASRGENKNCRKKKTLALLSFSLVHTIFIMGTAGVVSLPGVGFSEHGVSVAGHHLSGLEGLPDELLESLLGEVVADLLAQFLEPDEHLWSTRKLSEWGLKTGTA